MITTSLINTTRRIHAKYWALLSLTACQSLLSEFFVPIFPLSFPTEEHKTQNRFLQIEYYVHSIFGAN